MKPLFASIFTTISGKALSDAFKTLFRGRNQFSGAFKNYLGIEQATPLFTYYNARSAIYHGLKSVGVGVGDEVIIQAYTCISVVNSIIATGATPVYCDIDLNTVNMDFTLLEELITPNTKVIMIQHTMGIVAEIESIQKICNKHQIHLVEDCAQALGASWNNQKVGTFGVIGIYSFGRDKIVSATNGGVLIVNDQNIVDGEYLDNQALQQKSIGARETLKNLWFIVVSTVSYHLYRFKIGKRIYYGNAKATFIPLILFPKEKNCTYTDFSLAWPNILQGIAQGQLENIDKRNNHRRTIVQLYAESLKDDLIRRNHDGDIYLRAIYRSKNPQKLITALKKYNIHLGNPRYTQVIAGKDVVMSTTYYKQGSCPNAELLASETINLPNHHLITKEDAMRVIDLIDEEDFDRKTVVDFGDEGVSPKQFLDAYNDNV